MSRGISGIDALETINAAATVIASVEARGPHGSYQKRRWASCWSLYSCFGSNKNNKRIGPAVLIPEPTTPSSGPNPPTSGPDPPLQQPPSIMLPFMAPPSSPVSFIPSEAPSPTGMPTSIGPYSPSGPNSIFSIGPYAHDTRPVSPPVFSTFTTEPSTAPYTPPPESAHLTTPSSPEVPFARLLEPNIQRYPFAQCEFQSYQLQPGSPVSHLISPCSGISGSGTSSPFPDREFAAAPSCPFFLEFRTGNPPKLLDLEKIVRRDRENSSVGPTTIGPTVVNHKVSIEIKGNELVESIENGKDHKREEKRSKMKEEEAEASDNTSVLNEKNRADDGDDIEKKREKTRTITLGSTKEFNFDGVDGGNSNSGEPLRIDSSEWWVNEKVADEDRARDNHWLFFRFSQ
ncbi:hydroxyproline-rich glycoprotein family protein [Striga hermonthica]|uniref:Hydroxyproline-rich glycoprotein family protein n=1 Tax=Striga hermonthica TaxID=68872 RepID=A0A9N7NV10_STRHE|nr:hydroxyproline-rich glycoprotein family protein [Striga hermonthica]